jgi:adenine-specific DNA-methyltransferase
MTGRKAIDLAKQAHLADGKGYKKIVILAWDYELDFDNDFSRLKAAKKEKADCEFKVIPSDVLKYLRKTGVNGGSLADKIIFYQKPYLRMGEPNVRQRDGDTVPVVADSSLKKGKKYTIAVRVVDVFGNDASVTKELDLRG